MKIAYIPFSEKVNHPYDKNNILLYAKLRNLKLEKYDSGKSYDAVVLPPTFDATDLSILRNGGTKVIYQLVDNYLSEPKTSFKRMFRGPSRWILGKSKCLVWDYTAAQQKLCEESDAVICASEEQMKTLWKINKNVHLIFEGKFHITQTFKKDFTIGPTVKLVWEGRAENTDSLRVIREAFDVLSGLYKIELHIVTDLSYFSILDLYYPKATTNYLKSIFGDRFYDNTVAQKSKVFVYQWSLELFPTILQACDIAIIPLNKDNPMHSGKSKNKLLLMWGNGIPAVCSNTLSYNTASMEAGLDFCCETTSDWVEKIKMLIESKELREASSEKGLKHIRDKYSHDMFIAQWDNIFASIKD
jgi:glycosyltransferase involved in cell wall biosynthesis